MKIGAMLMFALLGTQAGLAWANDEDAAALAHYPSAEQVQSDLLATAGDAEPDEIAGRQAGRLMMLHSALAHTSSSSGNVSQASRPARELLDAYSQAYRSLDEKMQADPDWRKKCGYLDNLFDTCRRQRFAREKNYFKASPQAAQETAQLYFPPGYQDRFVDLTGVGGSRQRFADYQSERREAGRAERGREFRKKLPLILGGLSLIPLGIGIALFVLARRLGTSLARYEFHNTSAGGVVEFASFEASQAHERKRLLQRLLGNAGYLILAIGVLGFGLAVGVLIANSQ
ncbi:hypothetical protein [Pseudoxanthomonas sp. PXM02]|uniref:hypothetical protein n=1 Tax=Pseudoxanthomonas sp. PXM02 TaxID=2769294 RepID=UPI0017850E1B|nr:hypothetical protein [Pseudoxanthomonas sp. PXM02]MBD9477871.1 hypothetical protein [Pseudoxanthomonas sp. PXM02]